MSNFVSSTLMDALLESITDPVVVTDTEGRVVLASETCEMLTDTPADELRGRPVWDGIAARHQRQAAIQQFSLVWGEGGSFRWMSPGAEQFEVEWSAMPVADEQGQTALVLLVGDEIDTGPTEEDGDERYSRRGALRAHRRLERANRRLKQSNAELERFAAAASHDLQEPLRKIRAFGERLESRFGELLPARGRDYLARMRSAAERMSQLIDGLLTFARITTRAKPFEPVCVEEVVRDVLPDLEVRIEQCHGRVEVGDLPCLDADPLQLRLLFQNLIGNALKFHRPDTPPVVRVYEESTRHDDCRRVVVEDNGTGFDEKYLDRIFKVFERLHGRGSYEGTGIGLAIADKIVGRHRGRLTAESTPGAGSRFIVTLPVRQPDVSEELPEPTRGQIRR